ncbi:hypothetical protein OHA25_22615 [Nonomuraea sp. NBC_00507]
MTAIAAFVINFLLFLLRVEDREGKTLADGVGVLLAEAGFSARLAGSARL